MRIAVDAMGGDYAPREIVAGAALAVRELPQLTRVILVGDERAVEQELVRNGGANPKIEIRHASETVEMGETPALAIRRKKDSSISRAVDLVKNGEADAVVSAGNTGAVMVAATLKLRTLPGVERPAIGVVMPTEARPFLLIDAGANTDSEANLFPQFAAMGTVYSRIILHQPSPVVGLLSIGGEEGKGNELTRQAFGLLEKSGLNFRGNVEGHDLFEGQTDVVVCDGFVGNVVLKTSESVARAIAHWMKVEFTRNPFRKLGALLMLGAIKSMKERLDPELYGGALLLGVNGVCIITHGASGSKAILHAIRVACESLKYHLNEAIVEEVAGVNRHLNRGTSA